MKPTHTAFALGALLACACGSALALLIQSPRDADHSVDESQSMQRALAAKDAEIRRLNDEFGHLRGTPPPSEDVEPSRIPADDGHVPDSVAAELGRLRELVAEKDREIEQLRNTLDRARNDPVADLKDRFMASEIAQSLPATERELFFECVVQKLGEFPEPQHVQPLLDAVHAFRKHMADWRWKWREDPAGPMGDFAHPLATQVLAEQDAAYRDYQAALIKIYPVDLAKVSALSD